MNLFNLFLFFTLFIQTQGYAFNLKEYFEGLPQENQWNCGLSPACNKWKKKRANLEDFLGAPLNQAQREKLKEMYFLSLAEAKIEEDKVTKEIAEEDINSWKDPDEEEPPRVSSKSKKAPKKTSKTLKQLRYYYKKKKWLEAQTLATSVIKKKRTQCNMEYSLSLYLLARYTRAELQRDLFFEYQKKLVESLPNKCTPKQMAMKPKDYFEFKADAHLWLARLYWERNEKEKALRHHESSYNIVKKNQIPTLFIENFWFRVVSLGYENQTPQENLMLIEKFYKESKNKFNFTAKVKERLEFLRYHYSGLLQFQMKNYTKAIENFKKTESYSTPSSIYWQSRCLKNLNRGEEGLELLKKSIPEAGIHSIYDFWGAELYHQGTRLSHSHPIHEGDTKQRELFEYPDKDFIIFKNLKESSPEMSSQLSVIFMYAAIFCTERISFTSSGILTDLFKKDLKKYIPRTTEERNFIAWVQYRLENYNKSLAIMDTDQGKRIIDSPYLLQLLYPRAYEPLLVWVQDYCPVEKPFIWGVMRQESLYQAEVRSPVGAIGLMQLMPSTAKRILGNPQLPSLEFNLGLPQTNILAGTCYLEELLKRYDTNYYFAAAAYNAGEWRVDSWIKKRFIQKDMPLFVEWIPFTETKGYVQKVMANTLNMRE